MPVVEEDILLRKEVLNYVILDSKLEDLSPAQKHLLRMGPDSVRKIQVKLRKMAKLLDVPADQLPPSK